MFTRRSVIRAGAALAALGTAGAAMPLAAAGPPPHTATPPAPTPPTATPVLNIDSVETPFPGPLPDGRHIRLRGSQLDRLERLRGLVAAEGTVALRVHLDDAGRVLLDCALLAAGRRPGGAAPAMVQG